MDFLSIIMKDLKIEEILAYEDKFWSSGRLYPFYYEGDEYNIEDCCDLFVAMYSSPTMLMHDKGIYLGDGTCVYPCGHIG